MSETELLEPETDEVITEEEITDVTDPENPGGEQETETKTEEVTETKEQNTDRGESDNMKAALAESRFLLRQQKKEMSEMRQVLAELRKPAESRGEEPVIDPEKDPLGAIKYLAAKVNAYEQQATERNQRETEETQRTELINDLTTYLGENEQIARAQFADYDEAAQFQVQSRAAELAALGQMPAAQMRQLGASEEQIATQSIEARIRNEYLGLVHQARQNGHNPALLVYQQAKARGYTGPKPKEGEETTAQKQVKAMREGNDAPKTTRGAGGARQSSQVSHEDLMKAEGAEFDRLWALRQKQLAS